MNYEQIKGLAKIGDNENKKALCDYYKKNLKSIKKKLDNITIFDLKKMIEQVEEDLIILESLSKDLLDPIKVLKIRIQEKSKDYFNELKLLAEESGNKQAIYNMIYMYEFGIGTQKNHQIALRWYDILENFGYVGSIDINAEELVQRYDEEEINWYRNIANKGFEIGKFYLGAFYTIKYPPDGIAIIEAFKEYVNNIKDQKELQKLYEIILNDEKIITNDNMRYPYIFCEEKVVHNLCTYVEAIITILFNIIIKKRNDMDFDEIASSPLKKPMQDNKQKKLLNEALKGTNKLIN